MANGDSDSPAVDSGKTEEVGRPIRPQYFLSFAVLGAIIPFLSVYLEERGLDKGQIGTVGAIASFGVLLTPFLVTWLADTAIAGRVLMAGLFALAGVFLVCLAPARGFWPLAVLYSLHMFALQPVFPLQDGIHFAVQSVRRGKGLAEVPYHTVRIWGTIGYIVPGILLPIFLKKGEPMTPIVFWGAGFCVLGVINALMLPRTGAPGREQANSSLPTMAAAKAMLEPHVLVFCIAMFLIVMASQAYYQFYPLHLTERSGIDKQYVGVISSIGVAGEILFMLGFARLVKRLTLRRLMYLGALAVGLRLILLAVFASAIVAVAVQLIHGLTVLVVHVAPPIFLDQRAGDQYRNSIQGLYYISFAGAGRVLGAVASGYLAKVSIAMAFGVSGGICLVAMLLLYFAFHER